LANAGARCGVDFAASLARATAIAAQYGVKVQQIGTVTRGDFRIQLKVPLWFEARRIRFFKRGANRRKGHRKRIMRESFMLDDDHFHDHCGVFGVFGIRRRPS